MKGKTELLSDMRALAQPKAPGRQKSNQFLDRLILAIALDPAAGSELAKKIPRVFEPKTLAPFRQKNG